MLSRFIYIKVSRAIDALLRINLNVSTEPSVNLILSEESRVLSLEGEVYGKIKFSHKILKINFTLYLPYKNTKIAFMRFFFSP